jgi:hypothetical protein
MQKVYNEHMRGIDEEIVTLETKIRNTNIGYAMLQKLGWKDGEGLGARGQGERTNNDQMRGCRLITSILCRPC